MLERANEAAIGPPVNVIELPLVLAIGCAPSVVERFRTIGTLARSKFLVREIDLRTAGSAGYRPVIIVVPERLYAQRTAELDDLAERSSAALLTC
jgi:hypothetical protein